jgi:hypothetical protein
MLHTSQVTHVNMRFGTNVFQKIVQVVFMANKERLQVGWNLNVHFFDCLGA